MPRKKSPSSPYGQAYTAKETMLDQTTMIAKQIVEEQQQRQRDLNVKLKAARIEKEAAETTLSSPVQRTQKNRKKP